MRSVEEQGRNLLLNPARFQPLADVVTFRRGEQLKASNRIPGPFAVVTASRSELSSHNQTNYPANSVTVTSHGAYAGHVNFWSDPIWLGNNVFLLEPNPTVLPRFLFFALKNVESKIQGSAKSGGIPYLNAGDIDAIRIPVPSLKVQHEVVRILDTFTQLESELEAELEARRKQYEFYRNELLVGDGFERRDYEIGDIGKVKMCKRVMKSQTTSTGDVPFFKIGTFGATPDAFISRELFEQLRETYSFPRPGEILISASGTIGRTVVFDGSDSYFQDSNIVWIDNDESLVLNRYLKFLVQDIKWSTDGGTIRRLYNDAILHQAISLPDKVAQEKISDQLDALDALVNDKIVGLPAELAARRKQYEYFRDKLLTFPEVVSA